MVDWVESDRCVAACGANCRIVRISSDALLVPDFMEKLCSPECYDNCPNITDLYYNHAAGEGSAAAPSDISEYSIGSAFDVLDADPVPVSAKSPASCFNTQEDNPDY
ncbi:hypothetical protein KSP39_PZI018391 [Platanthera zijinensis]|uniref:Uncharacterized protein n=1 Tax=Platanthera zijinensis TaxID=2320716 RepID=A0AAP0B3K1_9ASPA